MNALNISKVTKIFSWINQIFSLDEFCSVIEIILLDDPNIFLEQPNILLSL